MLIPSRHRIYLPTCPSQYVTLCVNVSLPDLTVPHSLKYCYCICRSLLSYPCFLLNIQRSLLVPGRLQYCTHCECLAQCDWDTESKPGRRYAAAMVLRLCTYRTRGARVRRVDVASRARRGGVCRGILRAVLASSTPPARPHAFPPPPSPHRPACTRCEPAPSRPRLFVRKIREQRTRAGLRHIRATPGRGQSTHTKRCTRCGRHALPWPSALKRRGTAPGCLQTHTITPTDTPCDLDLLCHRLCRRSPPCATMSSPKVFEIPAR